IRDNYRNYPLQLRFFSNALYGPDQLRQRVAWALYKVMVVSGVEIGQAFWMSPYLRVFDQLGPDSTGVTFDHTFGNFRQLLDVVKVFTGLAFAPQPSPGITNYIDRMYLNSSIRNGGIVENAGNHDFTQKIVLDGKIIQSRSNSSSVAVANAYLDLNDALNIIYNHRNVAPFISQALIQALVTSNPSPGYVARVAAVFNLNRSSPNQLRQV